MNEPLVAGLVVALVAAVLAYAGLGLLAFIAGVIAILMLIIGIGRYASRRGW